MPPVANCQRIGYRSIGSPLPPCCKRGLPVVVLLPLSNAVCPCQSSGLKLCDGEEWGVVASLMSWLVGDAHLFCAGSSCFLCFFWNFAKIFWDGQTFCVVIHLCHSISVCI